MRGPLSGANMTSNSVGLLFYSILSTLLPAQFLSIAFAAHYLLVCLLLLLLPESPQWQVPKRNRSLWGLRFVIIGSKAREGPCRGWGGQDILEWRWRWKRSNNVAKMKKSRATTQFWTKSNQGLLWYRCPSLSLSSAFLPALAMTQWSFWGPPSSLRWQYRQADII